MIVYTFEWCDCIHESDFKVKLVHATKGGAYKSMRSELLRRWTMETEHKHNESREWVRMFKKFKPLENERWRVTTREVLTP